MYLIMYGLSLSGYSVAAKCCVFLWVHVDVSEYRRVFVCVGGYV